MKKKTLLDSAKGYGIGLLLGGATLAFAINGGQDMTHEDLLAHQYANGVDVKLLTEAIKQNPETHPSVLNIRLKNNAAAIAHMPSDDPARLAEMLLKGDKNDQRNIAFTPEMVNRIVKLQRVEIQALVNKIKDRPSNKRLLMLITEAERFLDEGNWVQAETLITRINEELTPEQASLVTEAHIADHHDKASRGEYSLYEDYLKLVHTNNPNHVIPTSEQAREHTIQQIENYQKLRQFGGHNSAPRVDFKDFGIEGFDIDAFEIKKVPYNPPKPAPLPSVRTTPADTRGR